MLSIDISNLIAKELKYQALDTVVDFVANQAKNFASDEEVYSRWGYKRCLEKTEE